MRYIYTETINSILIVDSLNGETHSIDSSEEFRYSKVKELIDSNNINDLTEVLYPQDFFLWSGFEMKGNSLYLLGEKLPNDVSLYFIQFKKEFKGIYNYWFESNKAQLEKNKKDLIELIKFKGYPITNSGEIFLYNSKEIINNEHFYNYFDAPVEVKKIAEYSKNLNEIILRTYGQSSPSMLDSVVKTFFNKNYVLNYEFIYMFYLLKDVVGIENLIKLMDEVEFRVLKNLYYERVVLINKFIKELNISEKKFIRILKESPTELNALIQSASTYSFLKGKIEINLKKINYRNFNELIRILNNEEFKLKTPMVKIDVPVNFHSLIFNKKALTFKFENKEFEIVYPKSNYDLISWSMQMNNCIKGYTDRASSPDFLILAIYNKEKELEYNIEISKSNNLWVLNQFKAYGNRGIEGSPFAKSGFNHIINEIINWKRFKFLNKKRMILK